MHHLDVAVRGTVITAQLIAARVDASIGEVTAANRISSPEVRWNQIGMRARLGPVHS